MSQKSGPGWVRGTGRRDCPVGYPVKGNEPSNVFYEPGDPGYPQVIPEMCFEDAAVASRVGFTSIKGGSASSAAAKGGAATGAVGGAAAAAGFLRATGGRECPTGYPIKGNEPSNVYYRPEDPGYSQVVPEVCFADVSEAEKGGFTRVKLEAARKTEPVAAVRKEEAAAAAGAAVAGAAAVRGADAVKAAPVKAADSARVAAPPPPPPPPPPPAPVAESSGGGWMKWLLPLLALAALAAGIWYFTRDDDKEEVTPTAVAATVAATTDAGTVDEGTVAAALSTDVAGADGTVAATAGTVEAMASGSEGTVAAAAGTVEGIAGTAGGTAEAVAATIEASVEADMATVEANIMANQATVEATIEAATASGTASPAASPAASPVAGGDITLEAVDIAFIPTELTISAADEPVTIKMENTGAALHNFAIDSLNIDVDVNPGDTVDIVIPAGTAPGTYDFYCNVPGHKEAGMVGTLIVE